MKTEVLKDGKLTEKIVPKRTFMQKLKDFFSSSGSTGSSTNGDTFIFVDSGSSFGGDSGGDCGGGDGGGCD